MLLPLLLLRVPLRRRWQFIFHASTDYEKREMEKTVGGAREKSKERKGGNVFQGPSFLVRMVVVVVEMREKVLFLWRLLLRKS